NREGGGEWEREFLTEPLKSVNLEELRLQRSPEEVAKLAKLLIEFKDLLSDGTLDFGNAEVVKHDTTCEIITTVDNSFIEGAVVDNHSQLAVFLDQNRVGAPGCLAGFNDTLVQLRVNHLGKLIIIRGVCWLAVLTI